MKIGVILARGGSKRIPRKNIKEFCGRPIICWTISSLIESRIFDKVIVSTDDEEIAEISKISGASVPFMRSKELSDDFVGTSEVMSNIATWMSKKKWDVEALCCVYATSVFIKKEQLKAGLDAIVSSEWSFAFSAARYDKPVFRSFIQCHDGGVEMLFPENYDVRSQDLSSVMYDAAQFYWGSFEAWLEGKKIFANYSLPIIFPNKSIQDIDTHDDWLEAERIFREQKKIEDFNKS